MVGGGALEIQPLSCSEAWTFIASVDGWVGQGSKSFQVYIYIYDAFMMYHMVFGLDFIGLYSYMARFIVYT